MNYDNRNRVVKSVDTGFSGTRTLDYDNRGNATSIGNLGMRYDLSGQPTAVSGSANGIGPANGNYLYDGNLKRVKSFINDGNGYQTIYNIFDSTGKLVHIYNLTKNEKTDYVTGPTGTIARVTNGTPTYLHPDHLGSAQAGTDHTGAVKWREQYTPFGETYENPAANDNLDGFTGHIKDKATGLNYMQARYYDPVIGRFLSIDPVGFLDKPYPGQFNRYAYTWNDPINANDPDGEFVNFVAKFVVDVGLEVAIQVATGQKVNVRSAVKGAAAGVLDPTKTVRKAAKLAGAVNDVRKSRAVAKVGCYGCFVAGTLIDTEDGLRPIEDIKVGDRVWAQDEDTGEIALKAITDLVRPQAREIYTVEIRGSENTVLSLIGTTDDHPWWVKGQGWLRTDQLTPSMDVVTRDGQTLEIGAITLSDRIEPAFNLTVADFETYFVGKSKVLVHNCKDHVNKNTKVGDDVKTFENSPEDFTDIGKGRFKDKKTGFIQTKSNSSHPPRPEGEIKSGTKKGEMPRGGKKITITGGAEGGCVLRKTGC